MQEVAGSTPAFSTKERRTDGCAVFCWSQKRLFLTAPPRSTREYRLRLRRKNTMNVSSVYCQKGTRMSTQASAPRTACLAAEMTARSPR